MDNEQIIKKILVDKSFIVKLLFDELNKRSKGIVKNLLQNEIQLITTESVIYKVVDEIYRRSRKQIVYDRIADKALILLEELNIWIIKSLPVLNEVSELKKRGHKMSLDSLIIVSLAKRRKLDLWTGDRSMNKKLREYYKNIRTY